MALKAGRVGVTPDQVDPYGKIIGGGGGGYVLPTASADTLGGVKVGTGLSIENGVLSSDNPTPYILPTADADTLGGVKIGSGLSMTDGVLSALASGAKIYSKDFQPTNTGTLIGSLTKDPNPVAIYKHKLGPLNVSGYTFIGYILLDKFTGYFINLLSSGIYYGIENGIPNSVWLSVITAELSLATWGCRAFYVKNEDIEVLT